MSSLAAPIPKIFKQARRIAGRESRGGNVMLEGATEQLFMQTTLSVLKGVSGKVSYENIQQMLAGRPAACGQKL
eukprot:1158245-Pelagomonas_calceolata.AAC.1